MTNGDTSWRARKATPFACCVVMRPRVSRLPTRAGGSSADAPEGAPGLEHDRQNENRDHRAECHDRVRPVHGDGERDGERGCSQTLPRDPPNDAEAHESESTEEDRDAEPERPAPCLRQGIQWVLESLLRGDGVEDDPEHDRVVEVREDVTG